KCPPLPTSLLYTSRAISAEAAHILYSENSFTIGRSDVWGLRPLRNLSVDSLKSIRSLTVRLNNCECIYNLGLRREDDEGVPFQGLFPCHPLCRTLGIHDKPLRSRARQDIAVFTEWQQVVSRMAAHCRPDVLGLDLVCDTLDMDTANLLTEKLVGLPRLRNCSIRLSHIPSWDHYTLARETVIRLVGELPNRTQHEKPKLYHLPQEILIHILGYSELIAPYDLEWQPEKGLVPFDCCKTCTATLDCCACSFYHGAYSCSCTCWRLPVSIFLVNRQVYNIAMSIFYQHNRFIVLPKGGRLDDVVSSETAIPALVKFIQDIPSLARPLLRSIGLAIPLFECFLVPNDDRLLAEWEHGFTSLAAQCVTKDLRLSLFIGYLVGTRGDPGYEKGLQQVPQLLTNPLKRLQGLKDLFIYLQWPYGPSTRSMTQFSSDLEKDVMGLNYNAEVRGKWDHLPRLWYDGESRERTVITTGGRRIWPPDYGEDAYGPPLPPLYTYTYA
ncbi:hypothetical protein F5Y04DRAFT_287473, partial [Hypomontagnella monticulosa]